MAEITEEMIEKIYKISNQVFNREIRRTDGINILSSEYGMDSGSAGDYIQSFKQIRNGFKYTRTINAMAIEYFLIHIFLDGGKRELRKAVNAVSLHNEYYENIRGTNMNTNRAIINKFTNLIQNDFTDIEQYIKGLPLLYR
jgi:5-methylcytosine-specific restriction protein A